MKISPSFITKYLPLALMISQFQLANAGSSLSSALSIEQYDHKLQALALERRIRVAHAKELLGTHYSKSVVRKAQQAGDISAAVFASVQTRLHGKWKSQARRIASAIIEQSKIHGFDPMFLTAVIEHESSFDPTCRGSAGEVGLMQILPTTGKWLAQKLKFKWHGEKSLRDPVQNIRLGSAYLASLREKFDSQARLYLAAYNMGEGNLQLALNRQIWPKVYPSLVMKQYLKLYEEMVAQN